ncbi:MAG TPA: hypothetical protein VFB31_15030 [Pseudolabrys sp.]|nr:hypothetical protein [Pseudolabrys sp.]
MFNIAPSNQSQFHENIFLWPNIVSAHDAICLKRCASGRWKLPLMPVACRTIILALLRRAAARALFVCTVAVAPMPSMSEQVHGDEGNGKQYPDPVR